MNDIMKDSKHTCNAKKESQKRQNEIHRHIYIYINKYRQKDMQTHNRDMKKHRQNAQIQQINKDNKQDRHKHRRTHIDIAQYKKERKHYMIEVQKERRKEKRTENTRNKYRTNKERTIKKQIKDNTINK